jgi:hypothetical protein
MCLLLMENRVTGLIRILKIPAAVLASGGITYAAMTLLGWEPVRPALIVALIVLAKLALRCRSDRRK